MKPTVCFNSFPSFKHGYHQLSKGPSCLRVLVKVVLSSSSVILRIIHKKCATPPISSSPYSSSSLPLHLQSLGRSRVEPSVATPVLVGLFNPNLPPLPLHPSKTTPLPPPSSSHPSSMLILPILLALWTIADYEAPVRLRDCTQMALGCPRQA